MIDKSREHLGLSDLEKPTEDGGVLHVHIGDALSDSTAIPRGYAGKVIMNSAYYINFLLLSYF